MPGAAVPTLHSRLHVLPLLRGPGLLTRARGGWWGGDGPFLEAERIRWSCLVVTVATAVLVDNFATVHVGNSSGLHVQPGASLLCSRLRGLGHPSARLMLVGVVVFLGEPGGRWMMGLADVVVFLLSLTFRP